MTAVKTLSQRVKEGVSARKDFFLLGENIVRLVRNRMEGSDVVSDVIALNTLTVSTVPSARLQKNPNSLKMGPQYTAFLKSLNATLQAVAESQKIEPVAPEIFAVPIPDRVLFYRITGAPDAEDNVPIEYLPGMDFLLRPEPAEEVRTKAPIKSVYLLLLSTPETIRTMCVTDMDDKKPAVKDPSILEVYATSPKEKASKEAAQALAASGAPASKAPF